MIFYAIMKGKFIPLLDSTDFFCHPVNNKVNNKAQILKSDL